MYKTTEQEQVTFQDIYNYGRLLKRIRIIGIVQDQNTVLKRAKIRAMGRKIVSHAFVTCACYEI